MDGHTHTRRQRTIAVPLLFLMVMCFLCALCHSSVPQAAPGPVAAADCPEQAEESAWPVADVPAQGVAHGCQAVEGHGLPTAPPLFLVALGVVLAFASLSAPRPAPRPHRPEPAALHGSGLLTLLCVQRV
ncbi:hypothetical protein DFP74_5037 [Nocardiopsis sp. Huas11]|uniref:hypothetical protein n=1 Tax=Nocardiopsis sp. Huas11 TaxID=2183912 RepID=UPI000EACD4A0|nr:hypothetical protein [Nocardiopsis sp. Huas11]RKS09302.1 hypothetical protein DFP74_5037 [Nocardiopsis sp. Huas11]